MNSANANAGPRSARVAAIQAAHIAALLPGWRRFGRALDDPAGAQRALLLQTLRANADTPYGRAHGFGAIRDAADYQARVPTCDADSLRHWIDRVGEGERCAMTAQPVEVFERSSGSTAGDKRIPYTAGLRAQFNAATSPWLLDMHLRHPALWGRRSYWSISPAARAPAVTVGGVPIGLADDAAYFSPLERWAIRRCWAVDPAVCRAPDMQTWRRQTATQLLAAQDLGFISVWSPTFLIELMQWLTRDLTHALRALAPRVALALRKRLDRAPLNGRTLWPGLSLISCWCDGPSAAFLPALRRWFPGVTIAPKGLLATEGVVSFPWGAPDAGAIPAITSHFLEFIDLASPARAPLLVSDLTPGGRYSPLLTTAGGLYRYHLKDVVEALPPVGTSRLARLRFLGRADGGSDLCGEKLSPQWVADVLDRARQVCGYPSGFMMLAPRRDGAPRPPRYVLYVEASACSHDAARALRAAVEAALMGGHHYKYARDLGQLDPVEVCPVEGAWERYARRGQGKGMRLGDIKPKWVDAADDWHLTFSPP